MSDALQLSVPAAHTLKRWHTMLATADLKALPELLAPDAVFRSPMAHTPYPGAPRGVDDPQHCV